MRSCSGKGSQSAANPGVVEARTPGFGSIELISAVDENRTRHRLRNCA
jgi:hypothetical protein